MSTRRAVRFVIALTLLCASLLAQTAAPQKRKAASPDVAKKATRAPRQAQLWMEDAKVITTEIEHDMAMIYAPRRSIAQARLAEAWWKNDPQRAAQWLEAAERGVTRSFPEQRFDDGVARVLAAGTVVEIASRLNDKVAERIVESIIDDLPELAKSAQTEEEKSELSFAMQGLSLSSFGDPAKFNPKREYKIATATMRLGRYEQYLPTVLNLYVASRMAGGPEAAKVSDQLTNDLLDLIEAGEAPLSAYSDVVGAMLDPEEPSSTIASQQARERTAALAFTLLTRARAEGMTQQKCKDIRVWTRDTKYLPQDAQMEFAAAMAQCDAVAPVTTKQNADAVANAMDDPDALLKLASAETNPGQRLNLKRTAVYRAQRKDPWRALAIINDMSEDEREVMDNTRSIIEMEIARKALKENDYASVQTLLNRSPQPSLTAMTIAMIALMMKSEATDGYAMTLLPTARKALEQDWKDSYAVCTQMLGIYDRLSKPESPIVLQKCFKEFNASQELIPFEPGYREALKRLKPGHMLAHTWWGDMAPARLPNLLDVVDGRLVRAQIDELRYPMLKVSLRLWLLKSVLKEYDNAMNAGNVAPKASARDK